MNYSRPSYAISDPGIPQILHTFLNETILMLSQKYAFQNSHTHKKMIKVKHKNIINANHPTPCLSAILPILLIVPARYTFVFAKFSFYYQPCSQGTRDLPEYPSNLKNPEFPRLFWQSPTMSFILPWRMCFSEVGVHSWGSWLWKTGFLTCRRFVIPVCPWLASRSGLKWCCIPAALGERVRQSESHRSGLQGIVVIVERVCLYYN